MPPLTSTAVRQTLIDSLQLDLIGPQPTDLDRANEILKETRPSKWYLTGFLVPYEAPFALRSGSIEEDEELNSLSTTEAGEDNTPPDAPSQRRAFFPSSIGLSFLLAPTATQLTATVTWGDYAPIELEPAPSPPAPLPPGARGENPSSLAPSPSLAEGVGGEGNPGTPPHPPAPSLTGGAGEPEKSFLAPSPDLGEGVGGEGNSAPTRFNWQRTGQARTLTVAVPDRAGQQTIKIPDSNGLQLVLTVQPLGDQADQLWDLPAGTRTVSLFLVNNRPVSSNANPWTIDSHYIFQATLVAESAEGFLPRANLSNRNSDDRDRRTADLQYAADFEYVVGHNVSAAHEQRGDRVTQVRTTWIPIAAVPRVVPSTIEGVELGMEAIAAAPNAAALQTLLGGLPDRYGEWIAQQRQIQLPDPRRQETAEALLAEATFTQRRIARGLALLQEDADCFEAFRLANRAIATALRQRNTHDHPDRDPVALPAPTWRPFQLAFMVLNLEGIARPDSSDRELVDLLYFPTGGGKTEAYLGLAAFAIVLRRLRHQDAKGQGTIAGAGLSVLMRYTLRLLTLDQLGRAATLICALERLRRQDPRLGPWPFEIGLWVGSGVTPNRLGKKEKGRSTDADSARSRTLDYKKGTKAQPPIPIEHCPWCGTALKKDSFRLEPHEDAPTDLRVHCPNRHCDFTTEPIPIVAIDESIYRRLPCFLIATVDKFANLPWVGQTAALFGKVDRFDPSRGFFGPADGPNRPGSPLPGGAIDPPDLIIQDELHLISGPLGTLAGLYEIAIDTLSGRTIPPKAGSPSQQPKRIGPKIVASTATVRQAQAQAQALFGRNGLCIFPPPSPDRHDSFFAHTANAIESPPRLYVGIAAQGRSLKVVMLQTYLALLATAQKQWEQAGGNVTDNPVDPYMTLLGYFNALRELGGSRRIVEDEVNARLNTYSKRLRLGETDGPFANRKIDNEPLELTSRVSTAEVAKAKTRLAAPFHDRDHVDVVLATNMISVGLDITRLGLMVVLGQPKTASEYIQATSRVGRDNKRPGLVVTLLNIHRPRDRSHYERFGFFHDTFYRDVEASSVTPFSDRALERGLAAITVALARLGHGNLTAPTGVNLLDDERSAVNLIAEVIGDRAAKNDPRDTTHAAAIKTKLRAMVTDLLDTWSSTVCRASGPMQYQRSESATPANNPLLRDFLEPDLPRSYKFKAQRSLRDVEPTVRVWLDKPND